MWYWSSAIVALDLELDDLWSRLREPSVWIASAWADFFSEERGFARMRVRRKWLSMNADVIERGGVCSARIAHCRSEALVQRREHITLDESGERVG